MRSNQPKFAFTTCCPRVHFRLRRSLLPILIQKIGGSSFRASSTGSKWFLVLLTLHNEIGAAMKNTAILCLASLALGPLALSQDLPSAPERAPLLMSQEIPLPHVEGRIDHFTFDAKRKRVIGAALGNDTVEVVDTFAGRDIHSIAGAANPQGVVFVGDLNKLFVANGADGKLRVYDGDSFKLLDTIEIGEDPDNVRYDPAEKRVYVAYGGDDGGGVAVIEAATGTTVDDAPTLHG